MDYYWKNKGVIERKMLGYKYDVGKRKIGGYYLVSWWQIWRREEGKIILGKFEIVIRNYSIIYLFKIYIYWVNKIKYII